MAKALVGGRVLGIIEAQSEKGVGSGTPDANIFLARSTNKVGSDFGEVGFANLQIVEQAKRRFAKSDFDGVEERPTGPGFFAGTKFDVRGLHDGRICFGRRGWRVFAEIERAGAEQQAIGKSAVDEITAGR